MNRYVGVKKGFLPKKGYGWMQRRWRRVFLGWGTRGRFVPHQPRAVGCNAVGVVLDLKSISQLNTGPRWPDNKSRFDCKFSLGVGWRYAKGVQSDSPGLARDEATLGILDLYDLRQRRCSAKKSGNSLVV